MSIENEPVTAAHTTPEKLRPVLIDLGSRSKKAIKDLKRGEGALLEEVEDTLDEIRHSLGEEYLNPQILPVYVIFRQKDKITSGSFPFVSPLDLIR